MKQNDKILAILAAAAFTAAAVFSAAAQEDGSAPAEPAGEEAGAETGDAAGELAGGEAEQPAVEVKPRPAEIMPLTSRSLLLDVVHTGQQYVAVGDRGGIVVSPDGKEWTQMPVPVRAALTAVYFADPNNGWAVGHDAAIVATQDAGKTWTLQHFAPAEEKPFLDVLFLDAQRGFAVGAYGLFKQTQDGGQSWTDLETPIREEEVHFNSIIKLGNGHLLIAGETGMLALSEDQGASWKKLTPPYDNSLFGALPVGDKGALIFGLRGNAYLTQDVKGGKWTKVETQSVASMFGGTVLPDGKLAMVGLNGIILITDTSGQVTAVQTPTGTPLSAAVPVNGTLLAVGESGIQNIALQ